MPLAPGARVAVVGADAEGEAAHLAERGLAATAIAAPPAALLAENTDRGPFDAALLLVSAAEIETSPVCLRLLGRLRRWSTPGGLLHWRDGTPQARELAVRAGYQLEAEPITETGWTVARAGATPPHGLAVATHRRAAAEPRLDLRWCPDEGEWLAPTPEALWAPLLQQGEAALAAIARAYAVEDPYGAGRSTAALASFFGCALEPAQISWGAGVSALLHDLAALAHGGPLLVPALAHPDLAAWATAAGVRTVRLPIDATPDDWRSAIAAERPGLVQLDCPDLLGRRPPLAEIAALARSAESISAIVLIDETYGSYFAAQGSAVPLTRELPNLVVLRSLSKGTLSGGLRAGFAVASPALAAEVRERVTALGVSALALAMALALLQGGDLCAPLRARVRAVKPEVAAALARRGIGVLPGDPELPWVMVDDADGAARNALAAKGIAGKRLGGMEADGGPFRLSLPLSAERLALWRALMTAEERTDDGNA